VTDGRLTIVQMARLGDLAQTWPVIVRARAAGRSVKLVVQKGLEPLAALMVGGGNVVGIDSVGLRSAASGSNPVAAFRDLRESLAQIESDEVLNLNFHPAIAIMAESIRSACHRGARWRDVIHGVPSDSIIGELFRISAGSQQTSRHLSDIWAGYFPAATYSNLAIPPETTTLADRILCDAMIEVDQEFISIVVGAGMGGRSYPAECWSSVADRLKGTYPVALVGSIAESETASKIVEGSNGIHRIVNLCGQTDPASLAGLLRRSALTISTDTGPLHVAAITGARCLGVYWGSMHFRRTGPYGPGNVTISPDRPDYPCLEIEMERRSDRVIPPPPELIAQVALALLSGNNPPLRDGWRIWRATDSPIGLDWIGCESTKELSLA
jgi:ADP-heptose:LPS heptosyltransferase